MQFPYHMEFHSSSFFAAAWVQAARQTVLYVALGHVNIYCCNTAAVVIAVLGMYRDSSFEAGSWLVYLVRRVCGYPCV